MHIGIFSKTFPRQTLGETLEVVVDHGLRRIQFDLSCAVVSSMPERIDPALVASIRRDLDARQITVAALSGTYNMIHPDIEQRNAGLSRLWELASVSHGLGASIITLSTGTRDPENMWRSHPHNQSPEAWNNLVDAMGEAVTIAQAHDIVLAFEPEVNNVVDSAQKARRLLDTIQSPHLKVCIDAANLFHAGELPRMEAVLEEAFALLSDDIVVAHAKDLRQDGDAGHEAAGTGLLDYDLYVKLLRHSGFDGALILHSLTESHASTAIAFLRARIDSPDSV